MKIDYIFVVLVAVLAVTFWFGKGSWLIAGYNSMSDEEKQQYDTKKVCRFMSCIMVIIDILLIIWCTIGENATNETEEIFGVLVFGISILAVILANIVCRKK